jgi:hypothetical protein
MLSAARLDHFERSTRHPERNFQVNTMGLPLSGAALCPGHDRSWPRRDCRHWQYVRTAGKTGLCRVCADKWLRSASWPRRLARELGPQGVHVSYLVIDAVIDLEWTRERFKGKPDEFFIKPSAIAAEIWHIVHQERSAWSFNVELRPFGKSGNGISSAGRAVTGVMMAPRYVGQPAWARCRCRF